MSYLHVWKCCDVILFGGPILWHWWSCWWWRDVDRRSEGYAEDFCPVQLWSAVASRNTSCCCLAAFVVESPWGSGWIMMVAWPANRDNHLSKYKRIWTAQPVPRWQNGSTIKDNTILLALRNDWDKKETSIYLRLYCVYGKWRERNNIELKS